MSDGDHANAGLSRRELLSTAATAVGALVVGFWLPQPASTQIINPEGATWAVDPGAEEINAWVVVAPDETVTIRIAQTELGQGVWTSNAMMVCEELQCDWSKVSPQYASVNRDGKEMAPQWTLQVMGKGATDPFGGGEPEFGRRIRTGIEGIPDSLYRRMRTNAAASVKDGRYYLQLAGAEARERLLLAAAKSATSKTDGSWRTTLTRSRCRESRKIRGISISPFSRGHWLRGMGHDRGTSVQPAIADAVFQITGKRYRDLPFRNHDLTWS